MKRSVAVIYLFGMLCLTNAWSEPNSDREADHQALRLLRDRVESAVNAQNMASLRSCLAQDFTFVTSDQSVLRSEAELNAYYKKMFKSKDSPILSLKTKIDATVKTKFAGPDSGYCYGTSRDVFTLRNKRKVVIPSTWSAMVVREDGNWKISMAHVGVNFLENPVMEANGMSWFGGLLVKVHLRKLPGEVNE
jgi:hypothetical protein